MKILGYNYTLAWANHAEIGSAGRLCGNTQKLEISEGLHPDQIASTVLHEIIEALNYHLELGVEHSTIMSLEAGLYQVLVDNGIDVSPLTVELKPKEF